MMELEETIVDRLEKEINIIRPQALEIQLKLYDIFIPTLCAVIIPINLLICFSSGLILNKRQQPRSTYILLGNVALSDLLIGLVTLAMQYYPDELHNEMVCCIGTGLHVCSTLVSIWSAGLIGIDRYLYILYGLHYQRLISSQRARGMILVTWFLAGVISFLPAFGLRNPTHDGKLCWFIVLFPRNLLLIAVSFGIIPLVLILVLYSIILKHALVAISHQHRASMNTHGTRVGQLRLFRGNSLNTPVDTSLERPKTVCVQEDREVQSSQSKGSILNWCRKTEKSKNGVPVYGATKWKAIKVVLLTTGAFIVTWVPYITVSVLYAFCDPKSHPDYCHSLLVAIARPLTVLGMCNSLLNPIIYAWWHNGFRESVKKIFERLLGERLHAEEMETLRKLNQKKRSQCKINSEMMEQKQKSRDSLTSI